MRSDDDQARISGQYTLRCSEGRYKSHVMNEECDVEVMGDGTKAVLTEVVW